MRDEHRKIEIRKLFRNPAKRIFIEKLNFVINKDMLTSVSF